MAQTKTTKIQPHLKIEKSEKYVLLPGDPGRIEKIARFLENKKEVSLNREYRTITGDYKNVKLQITSSGIGCPAAAIAVEELVASNAKTIIRVGTCGGLLKEMKSGSVVIPKSAFCGDGTTKEYGQTGIIEADKKVYEALAKAAENLGIKYFTGTNRTHDAFYESTENFVKIAGKGFASSEMECSAVLTVAKLRKIAAGAILVVVTPEPPEEVAANPNIVYQLVNEEAVFVGTENAIKIALEAIKILEGGDKD